MGRSRLRRSDQADRTDLLEEEASKLAGEGLGVQARRRQLPARRASPLPKQIFGLEPLEWLLEQGCVVVCAGGGGIPVMYTNEPVPAGGSSSASRP